MTHIYVLKDSDDTIRYVGKTYQTLSDRLSSHISSANQNNKTHKANWIRKCISNGYAPTIHSIEVIPKDRANEREIFWIALYIQQGCKLTNTTKGGDGGLGLPMSNRLKKIHSERMKLATHMHFKKGHTVSVELRQIISKTQHERIHSSHTEEWKKNAARVWQGRHHTIESKHKVSKAKVLMYVKRKADGILPPSKHMSLEARTKIGNARRGKKIKHLTLGQINQIREEYNNGILPRNISIKLNINYKTVCRYLYSEKYGQKLTKEVT